MAVVMTFSHYCQREKSNAGPQYGDLVWKRKISVQDIKVKILVLKITV